MILLAALAALATQAAPASAKVAVVAVNQDLAWVVGAIGGTHVAVDYLARSDQDAHLVDPRPSQVVKLARADLLVRIGMDLDMWLDPLIQAAANRRIAPGGSGYVDASRGVRVLEAPSGKLDASMGDIHVYGNPHYFFGPANLRAVARNVTDGLIRVEPGRRATYEAGFSGLMTRLQDARSRWGARMAPHRGAPVVTYHKSLVYFLSEFGLKEAGNVEPRPGLEPTPGHVSNLAREMKQAGVKVILTENFRPRRFADLLARQSGAQVVVIPGGVGAIKGADDYFSFMDMVVDRVSAAL